MKKSFTVLLVTAFIAAPSAIVAQGETGQEWLKWRGPNGDGKAVNQNPPFKWDEQTNVLWKTKIPGRGHASPTVVGNQIILETSDESSETQSVVSYDRTSGRQLWITEVNQGNFNTRIYPTNTHASSTVASNGKLLFALFNNNQSAQLTALNLEGEILWQKKAGVFIPRRYQFGFGASPIVYKDTVIVSSECERDGSMVALDVNSGEEVWRVERLGATSYSTPSIATVDGREQLFISGAKKTTSYDPATGKLLWQVPGPWSVTCGTAVWTDDMIFVSGGYPTPRTMGIRVDGAGEIVWQHNRQCYEQSMLQHNGYIYALTDSGVMYCWRADDGQEMWKERLERSVSASPVLVGDNIFISVQKGTTYIMKANPKEYQPVGQNQLGNVVYATPTFVDNKIFFRAGTSQNKIVQEWLYCIGEK